MFRRVIVCAVFMLCAIDAHAVEMTRATLGRTADITAADGPRDQQDEVLDDTVHHIGVGGPGSTAAGGRIGSHVPNDDRIGGATPVFNPDGPQPPGGDDGRSGRDPDELDFFERAGNAYEGFQNLTTSIVTLAAGLTALTAENGSFFGKIFGAAKVFSGTVGLVYGGDNMLSAFTGKYFLPDSFRSWGRAAAFVNRGVAMMEVTKLAFSKLGTAWGKITGKDKEKQIEKKEVETANAVNDLYRFNCGSGGACFLPSASGAVGVTQQPHANMSPEQAYVTACRSRYANGPAPGWWDHAVCRNAASVRGLDSDAAARIGAQDAMNALQKGDAYWAACRSQAPDADLDGSFYAKACGSQWTADPNSGATVPIWLSATTWQQARQWGLQNGAAGR